MLAIRKGVDSKSICSILEAFPNAAQISSIEKKQLPLHELLKRPQTYLPSSENKALATLINAYPQALTAANSEGQMPYEQRLTFTVVTKDNKQTELTALLDFSQPKNYISKDALRKLGVIRLMQTNESELTLNLSPDDRSELSFHERSEGLDVDLKIGCPSIGRPTKDDEFKETLRLLENLRCGIPDHKGQLQLHRINIESNSERVETLLKYNELAVETEDGEGNLPIHCFLSSIVPKIAFVGDNGDEHQLFFAEKLRSEFNCQLLLPETHENSYDCLVKIVQEADALEAVKREGKTIVVTLGDDELHTLWIDVKTNIYSILKAKVEHEDKKKSVKDILSLLLEKNIRSLLHPNKDGDLPLHVALLFGHDTAALKLVEEFEKHRTKLESPDQPEVEHENKSSLQHMKKVKMTNPFTDNTALHMAIQSGASFEVVKKIFDIYPKARVEKNKDKLLVRMIMRPATHKSDSTFTYFKSLSSIPKTSRSNYCAKKHPAMRTKRKSRRSSTCFSCLCLTITKTRRSSSTRGIRPIWRVPLMSW